MNLVTKISIQDIYDEYRVNNNKIINLTEQLEELKEELKNCKNEKKNITKKLKMKKIDLIKSKKIKWVETDLNSWRTYVEHNDDPAIYYIYYNDGSIYQQGYYEGVYNLNKDELNHFEQYLTDYFYYGYPMYLDRNAPYSEATECELAFGGGSAYIKEFNWD